MVKKKLMKIIAILILFVTLFPYTTCLAISQAEAGVAIARYAYNFCMKYGANSANNQTIYDWSENRISGYKLMFTSGVAEGPRGTKSFTNKYPMDCVGFVSTMIHQSLGIGSDDTITFFIDPQNIPSTYFEPVNGAVQPGDVYRSPESADCHVVIYLGSEGKGEYVNGIAHSTPQGDKFTGAMLSTTSWNLSSYTPYRIKESIVSGVNASDVITDPVTKAGLGASTSMIEGSGSQSEFYYNGIPDGKYSVGNKFTVEWLVDSLLAVFEFLVTICAYILRMVFVGWTFIVEEFITNSINSITKTDTVLDIDSTTIQSSANKETADNITIEKIIFDKVKVFNVNFFNTDK